MIDAITENLTEQQQHRLMHSKNFCMLPWVHLHGWPDGRAYPCCLAKAEYPVGNLKEQTMLEVWNADQMREIRRNMLADQPCKECNDCYEQEAAGFTSMRNDSNKNFGHLIKEVEDTYSDGTHPEMKLRHWDVRFNNICNLKCRSCGSTFSSRWYDDDVKLQGQVSTPRVQFAGRTDMDIWEQMQPHIPFLEQIYFAGGEPLIMEEHNRILKMLIETGNTQVRLIYNTNLTELKFKRENVIELWKHFPQICVAASLDDIGDRAGIIRSGTDWARIEQNIQEVKRECPHIDFIVSTTLSMMNIWNLTNFHRYLIEKEFIEAKDFDLNLLHGPRGYRIDILPIEQKLKFKKQLEEHIQWLETLDDSQRSINGFVGAINFMMSTDNSQYLEEFWEQILDLDWARNESFISVVPELECLLEYKPLNTRI